MCRGIAGLSQATRNSDRLKIDGFRLAEIQRSEVGEVTLTSGNGPLWERAPAATGDEFIGAGVASHENQQPTINAWKCFPIYRVPRTPDPP